MLISVTCNAIGDKVQTYEILFWILELVLFMKMLTVIILLVLAVPKFTHTGPTCPEPCNTQSDCRANECCINNIKPKGRRSDDNYLGHCQPLGEVDSACYVGFGSASHPPDNLVYGCPCSLPLICKGNGTYYIPLGELGFCERQY